MHAYIAKDGGIRFDSDERKVRFHDIGYEYQSFLVKYWRKEDLYWLEWSFGLEYALEALPRVTSSGQIIKPWSSVISEKAIDLIEVYADYRQKIKRMGCAMAMYDSYFDIDVSIKDLLENEANDERIGDIQLFQPEINLHFKEHEDILIAAYNDYSAGKSKLVCPEVPTNHEMLEIRLVETRIRTDDHVLAIGDIGEKCANPIYACTDNFIHVMLTENGYVTTHDIYDDVPLFDEAKARKMLNRDFKPNYVVANNIFNLSPSVIKKFGRLLRDYGPREVFVTNLSATQGIKNGYEYIAENETPNFKELFGVNVSIRLQSDTLIASFMRSHGYESQNISADDKVTEHVELSYLQPEMYDMSGLLCVNNHDPDKFRNEYFYTQNNALLTLREISTTFSIWVKTHSPGGRLFPCSLEKPISLFCRNQSGVCELMCQTGLILRQKMHSYVMDHNCGLFACVLDMGMKKYFDVRKIMKFDIDSENTQHQVGSLLKCLDNYVPVLLWRSNKNKDGGYWCLHIRRRGTLFVNTAKFQINNLSAMIEHLNVETFNGSVLPASPGEQFVSRVVRRAKQHPAEDTLFQSVAGGMANPSRILTFVRVDAKVIKERLAARTAKRRKYRL